MVPAKPCKGFAIREKYLIVEISVLLDVLTEIGPWQGISKKVQGRFSSRRKSLMNIPNSIPRSIRSFAGSPASGVSLSPFSC